MKKLMFVFGSAALMLASCAKSVLELNNPNQITSSTFWKTENDVQSAIAATYGLLRTYSGGLWSANGLYISNGRGDDFFIRNDVANRYQLSTFSNTPDNATVNDFWNVSYRAIFRANEVLENIDKVADLDALNKKQYIAEAKFLRGLNYFNLVINFGDVPLHLTVPQTKDEYFAAKSPAADVWQQAMQDFKEAAADLPVSYPSEWIGRATKGAALAFLGKSYLYNKDWVNAEKTLKQLTTTPFNYQLIPDYGANFLPTNENNQESVFEIQLEDVGGTSPYASESADESLGSAAAQSFAPAEVSGWFEISPTDKLFNEFKKEKTLNNDWDPRMYATLIWDYPGATFYKRPFSGFSLNFGYHSMFKKYQNYWQDNELVGASGASDNTTSNNERILRYDDVLLMIAEALTMEGKTTDAYPYVQQIRDRAHLSTLSDGYSKEQMMSEIRHQRMLEFAREGQRFYDLRRWGLLQQELSNSDKVGKQFYVSKKHDYFPIPQNEINSNPLMTQNQNW